MNCFHLYRNNNKNLKLKTLTQLGQSGEGESPSATWQQEEVSRWVTMEGFITATDCLVVIGVMSRTNLSQSQGIWTKKNFCPSVFCKVDL